MNRRFHVKQLAPGRCRLDPQQSRHLRDVLRIGLSEQVELFDDAGRRAISVVCGLDEQVELQVETVEKPVARLTPLVIAAAVPKGPRADWMIEKLSELGTSVYVPLETRRGVVHPEAGKLQRWQRIAAESAKQCKRSDVMQIRTPLPVAGVAGLGDYAGYGRWCLSTREPSQPAMAAVASIPEAGLLAMVGPEGGWTDDEEQFMVAEGFAAVRLTRTILRVETAAIAMASLVMISAAGETKEQRTL